MNAGLAQTPNFFIVGAPKCGTTALHRYLSDHPMIFMPTLKEPHFYSSDLPGLRVVEDLSAYRALFDRASPDALVGEASASYLMSSEAVPAILRENAEARFIVMLRNPIEMAYALHAENFCNLSEDVKDFGKAWAMQDLRITRAHIPKHCREPSILQYRQVCAIGDQLERLFEITDPTQRHVVLFDDLNADVARCYLDVLIFLGLPADDRSIFPRANVNRRIRSRSLASLHRLLPELMGPFYAPAKRLGNRFGFSPSEMMARHNVVVRERPILEADFRRELEATFTPQVEKLSRLLNRNLSHWIDTERKR